ncbi:hypothetical protein F4808DRAFT_54521 [Astrocystis sublimbata]|nr:hypothetical protein F4808DRAFT_54521 [Astrocystis sublimbata]
MAIWNNSALLPPDFSINSARMSSRFSMSSPHSKRNATSHSTSARRAGLREPPKNPTFGSSSSSSSTQRTSTGSSRTAHGQSSRGWPEDTQHRSHASGSSSNVEERETRKLTARDIVRHEQIQRATGVLPPRGTGKWNDREVPDKAIKEIAWAVGVGEPWISKRKQKTSTEK